MKKLIVIALLCASFQINAQTKVPTVISKDTYLRTSAKSFKVCTTVQSVRDKVISKFGAARYSAVLKTDRVGNYWEYEVTFKNEEKTEVEAYLKSI